MMKTHRSGGQASKVDDADIGVTSGFSIGKLPISMVPGKAWHQLPSGFTSKDVKD
ncbi:MAG: hypothetical protein ACLR2G_09820 [Phascolarctobacterium faecium]